MKQNIIEIFQYQLIEQAPIILIATVFMVYLISGQTLSPSIVYSLLMIFMLMKFQLYDMPYILGRLIDTYTSMKRIEDYLLVEEAKPIESIKRPFDPFNYALEIQNASFAWKTSPDKEES